ncbi:MAG: transcription termination factor NusA [Patescibacteria group bacterium]|nr:transcription termination factor NusA [Patescibacteria group bacterium]
MLDIKIFNSALEQLEEERGIPKEKIIEAIEQALAAAYKKDYGKKGQIIRASFDQNSGKTEFSQVKIVVDDSTVRIVEEDEKEGTMAEEIKESMEGENEQDLRPRFNPEHHILLEDAKKIKKDVTLDEEIVFPLESKDDYGRIAAQTAKQVIIQKIREAEKVSVMGEYMGKKGEVVNGIVQRVEHGNVFVDLGRTIAILPAEEQIPNERYRQGGRIKAYVIDVTESPRGISIRLSRTHPQFIQKLFEVEAPEIESGVVEIKSIAREAGARSKIAVATNDEKVDPIGACVGQRGVRVSTVTNELAGEKIDIVEWSPDPAVFVAGALSPAKVVDIKINEEEKRAKVTVSEDQLSLAIGKGGQNVRLAAKLTGWRIDIEGAAGETIAVVNGEEVNMVNDNIVPEEIEPVTEGDETGVVEEEIEEKELAEEVVEEETGEVRHTETEDMENITPEDVEEAIDEEEKKEGTQEDSEK